jgi:hypothetical protein
VRLSCCLSSCSTCLALLLFHDMDPAPFDQVLAGHPIPAAAEGLPVPGRRWIAVRGRLFAHHVSPQQRSAIPQAPQRQATVMHVQQIGLHHTMSCSIVSAIRMIAISP